MSKEEFYPIKDVSKFKFFRQIFTHLCSFSVELDGYTLFGTLLDDQYRQALGNSRYNVVINSFGQSVGESAFNHCSSLPSFLSQFFDRERPASQLNPEFIRYVFKPTARNQKINLN